MASLLAHLDVDYRYFCTLCHNIFKNPVMLPCNHSFCDDCLKRKWLFKMTYQCPLCRRKSTKNDLRSNFPLKNMCDSFIRDFCKQETSPVRSETVCSLHSEKLKLFCLDHLQPVCVVCRDSRSHTDHRFRPIDEAADDYKEGLRILLKSLQDRIEHLDDLKVNWDHTAEHIKTQAQTTENQIREKFKKLRYFLANEEEARIAAVRREEVQKSGRMKGKIETLSSEIETLSETIQALEKELTSPSVTFLSNYKAERAKQRPLLEDPQLGPGALIDVAKHLGNLSFNIWNKMKELVTYSPVVLDPNTAGFNLFVFEDLKHLLYVENKSPLPKNPERLEKYPMVLGSEGFNSGTHSWSVEVRSDADWAVGVIAESVSRKGVIQSGFWEMRFSNGKYKVSFPPFIDDVLLVDKPLQKVNVKLDWSEGKLSFYDPVTNKHLYTFYQTFTERLFPFVNTHYTKPLSMLPQKVTVLTET